MTVKVQIAYINHVVQLRLWINQFPFKCPIEMSMFKSMLNHSVYDNNVKWLSY